MDTGALPAVPRSNASWVPVRNVLLYPHLWLAMGASAQRWWVGEVGPSTNWQGILGAAAAVIAGYGYLRLVRASEPDPVPSYHIRWVRENRVPMMMVVGVAALAVGLLLRDQHLVFGRWSLLVPVLCAGYLLPFRSTAERSTTGISLGLREVPGVKVIIVALAWTFITCGITNVEPWDYNVGMNASVAALQFGYFLAMAIAFDIGDLRYDRPGLRTVPQLLGIR